MTATSTKIPPLRHEEFCMPRPEADAPRIERFPHYEDDPRTGRSAVAAMVTRCVECGVAHYDRTEK